MSVEQGVPFAREYGGLLANRSFGGAQVSRTFYARGQTGQQLLLGAYQAFSPDRQGTVEMFRKPRCSISSSSTVTPKGSSPAALTASGKIEMHAADAVVLATGGCGNVFLLHQRARLQCHRHLSRHKKGALFNPCYTQIHPTCIPVSGDYQSKLTLMSESLRNDGRVWVPKKPGDKRAPNEIPEDERDYYLERKYPSFGNLAPRDISSPSRKRSLR